MKTKEHLGKLEDLCDKYPILVYKHIEPATEYHDEDIYYIAYLPDFGESACSCPGETQEDAVEYLKEVALSVIDHYLNPKNGLELPKPNGFKIVKE